MEHQGVYREIEERFGVVPGFLKAVPERVLRDEWNLLKKLEFDEISIPDKYRDLIGLAVSTAVRCKYCSHLYTEFLKQDGATDEEIKLAVSLAKSTVGWSSLLYGMQIDFDEFKQDVAKMLEYQKKRQPVRA